jgi:hypothetical protein
VGIGQQAGEFSDGGQTYIASMVTQDFIRSGAKTFITGVVYSDTTDNDFYDVGEAIAGRKVKAAGAAADRTGPGGGYELQFGETGIASMRFKQPGRDLELDVALGADNVKVDAVNGREIWTQWKRAIAIEGNRRAARARRVAAGADRQRCARRNHRQPGGQSTAGAWWQRYD